MSNKILNKGPLIDPGLCRCCRSIKKCRLLTTEYEWMGKNEVYCDLILDCYGLVLSNLDSDSKDCCICATCVVRLREAYAFRTQVLQCEELFLQAKLEGQSDNPYKIEVKIETEEMGDDNVDDAGDRSASDIEMEPTKVDTEEKIPPTDIKVKKRKTRKTSINKKEVLKKSEIMKNRLKNKLEKIDSPKPKRKENDDYEKILHNSTVLVQNSYICPFINRVSFYYCYYCKEQFTDPTQLREHTLKHDTKSFQNSIEYKKMPKFDITRVDCRNCNKTIDNLVKLKEHLSIDHSLKLHEITNEFLYFKLTLTELKCMECEETFPFFDALMKHMNSHFGKLVCDVCGACFVEVSTLKTHIRSHTKLVKDFPCEVCGKNFKSKYSRNFHISTVHEKKATINCYKCDQIFLSHALRNKHLIEQHDDKRTFPCKSCDKVYNRRKTLSEHIRRTHNKIFKHQCDFCDQKFYLPSRLKEHLATHTGERNYRCDTCDKSYPRLQTLQEHLRTHNTQKRYACDFCDSTFTQNGSLKNHLKSHRGFDVNAF